MMESIFVRTIREPMSNSNFEDGINLRENFERADQQEKTNRRQPSRPDMKGPSDISDILSGLKTKTINIQEQPPRQQQQQQQQAQQTQAPTYEDLNNSSTISISDLKDLQSDNSMPKKSKRRQKSDKNTLSLDI